VLEQKIDDLIAALDRNTASAGGGAAPTAGAGLRKTAAKLTFEMVKAAVMKVKDDLGKPRALAIVRTEGQAKDLASIKPARYQAVLTACEEAAAEVPADDDTPAEEDTL
jgi:hypothetical protein